MRRTGAILASLVVLAGPALLTPVAASGATSAVQRILAQCNANSRLTGHFTPEQLRQALAQMPADLSEYTDCTQAIRGQLLVELSHTPGARPRSEGSGGVSGTTIVIIIAIVIILGGTGATVLARWRQRERVR
jgi:hypothetical protein